MCLRMLPYCSPGLAISTYSTLKGLKLNKRKSTKYTMWIACDKIDYRIEDPK